MGSILDIWNKGQLGMYGTNRQKPKDAELESQISNECGVEYSDVISDLSSVREEIEKIVDSHNREKCRIAKENFSEKNLVRCSCGNKDQTRFVSYNHEGEIVCMECGAVVSSNALYEGDASRSFEGEEDNTQYGAPFNSLMSSSFNLSTRLVSSSGRATKLQRQQNRIDMNLSKTNRDDKETRIEYKDKMKNKARITMEGIAGSLDLSEAVLDLAHRYFCYYRDSRSKVTEESRRVAQCLILALRKIKTEGESIYKEQTNEQKFVCPQCQLSFGNRLDLQLHDCEKKEVQPKKQLPPLSSKLRPKLKDDLDRLRVITQKMYNCVNCVLKQTIKNLKEKLVLSGEYVIPLDTKQT